MKKQILFVLIILTSLSLKAQNNWWNNTVAYEIFVRSFYDTNGDGRGDFNGITQKLDYLNDNNANTKTDLGINLIWLMPINPSPSYHGYDVLNYKAVHPNYGNINTFKNFINEAHNRNIKVIIDLVINHTSSQHPWFIKSAANDPFYRNFYRWSTTPPTQQGPWGQQVWYPKNGSNYYALFWSEMPDLNFNYQPVRDSIFDIAKFWLKEMNVDGFRLDAAMYLYEEGNTLKNHPNTISFWKTLNDSCEAWKPNSLLLGEVWESTSIVKLYNDALDMCFDFNLSDQNLSSANSGNPFLARQALKTTQDVYNENQFASFLSNHDQNRVFDMLGNNIQKAKVAASLLLTQPGVPFLYYGEEVAMKGVKPDEDIRRPMQWSNTVNAGFSVATPWRNVNSNYSTYNVSTMQSDSNSIWNHYQKLIELRNNDSILMLGSAKNIISSANEIHSYQRSYKNEDEIILVNTSSTNISNLNFQFSRTDLSNESFLLRDVLTDSTFIINASNAKYTVTIPINAYATRILKFERLTLVNDKIKSNVKVYPNPAANFLHVDLGVLRNDVLVKIFSIEGRCVYENILNNNLKLDLSKLENGMYLISVDGYYTRFIKQ
jgi:glycosidase